MVHLLSSGVHSHTFYQIAASFYDKLVAREFALIGEPNHWKANRQNQNLSYAGYESKTISQLFAKIILFMTIFESENASNI